MKVNDPNLASLAATGASQTRDIGRAGSSGGARGPAQSGATGVTDKIHLSELVRSLRSLAADSPERQARIEQIARDYANGSYKVDAQATASKIIDDASSGNAR
jgi:flagellar biosynthesis anti-sigma factor FlgM